MITEVKGDILHTRCEAIAHGVAANDPMSEGLAKSLHDVFPSMHKAYHKWCHQKRPKPGEAWIWGDVKENGVRIINLLTQDGGYGKGTRPEKANIKNVTHALKALKKIIKKEKLKSLAIPALATGVGGLTWDQVKPIIYEQLEDVEIPIYLYSTFIPNQRAIEAD
jgi:O-acetyl-ADP-ribose deacetylase (regulator of RNase III)